MEQAPSALTPELHLVLRPTAFVRVLMGVVGGCGALLAVWAAATLWPPTPSIEWLSLAAIGASSIAMGLYYGTSEVHATPTRLWQRRYWRTAWSVPMSRVGTREGTGQDWALIHVFDLPTSKRIGAINWWVLEPGERVGMAEQIDRWREELGMPLVDGTDA